MRDFTTTITVEQSPAKVFQAMRPLTPADVVRGQYVGYREEADVAPDSNRILGAHTPRSEPVAVLTTYLKVPNRTG